MIGEILRISSKGLSQQNIATSVAASKKTDELWDKLVKSAYAAIRQRIDIKWALSSYDLGQCQKYIAAHMKYAGCEQEIFTEDAIKAFYEYSAGSARGIRVYAQSALCRTARQKHIDDHLVHLVIETDYPGAVAVWERNRIHVEQLFDYGSAVRRVMYATNAIESVNSGFRILGIPLSVILFLIPHTNLSLFLHILQQLILVVS